VPIDRLWEQANAIATECDEDTDENDNPRQKCPLSHEQFMIVRQTAYRYLKAASSECPRRRALISFPN